MNFKKKGHPIWRVAWCFVVGCTRLELAYLLGDLATSSPESYTLEEMKEISDGMFESTARIDAAMRADFEALPPEAQDILLDMLCSSDCMTPEFWKKTLLGEIPSLVSDIECAANK